MSIGAVVALHIVLVVYIAARPLGWRLPGMGAADDLNVAYIADDLMAGESASATSDHPVDPADLLESEAARRPRGDFVPPRLVKASVPDVATYARRAGVRSAQPARVILAVEVTEQGVANDIRVSSSSGNSLADSLAIEYARALRWNPATEQGRTSRAHIRLPVTFAVPD